jgi:DNA-binding transcriptional LysR family regulator
MNDSNRIDLNDLRLLMHVVEQGGYAAASRVLGIPKSTISQRIANLEVAVGTGLLRRTTRSLSLTEVGALLIPHARAMADHARDIEETLLNLGTAAAGTLRVTSSVAVAQFALAPLIPRFLEANPKVDLRISVSNRYTDLVGEGFDMAIRAYGTPLKDSTMVQRVIARTPWAVAASPAYLREHPVTAPVDLAQCQTLYFGWANPEPAWTLHRDDEEAIIGLAPRLWSDDMALLVSSAVAGGGIVAMPRYVMADALDKGALVPVLSEWKVMVSTITVLTPPRRQSSRLAKVFSDFLAEEFAPLSGGLPFREGGA